MPTFKVTSYVEASDRDEAKRLAAERPLDRIQAERWFTNDEIEAYHNECYENGEIACVDPEGHTWVVSDEDENYCYCERCGCCEY